MQTRLPYPRRRIYEQIFAGRAVMRTPNATKDTASLVLPCAAAPLAGSQCKAKDKDGCSALRTVILPHVPVVIVKCFDH